MGLADRDYMRSPPGRRGRTTRLDTPPIDGIIWEAKAKGSPGAEPPLRRRRAIVLALSLAGGTAVFTILWAIACAMIAAQWHGEGTTFAPPTMQGNADIGESNHGAR